MKKKNKTRSVTGLLFGFMERVIRRSRRSLCDTGSVFSDHVFYSLYSVSDYTGTVYTSDLIM